MYRVLASVFFAFQKRPPRLGVRLVGGWGDVGQLDQKEVKRGSLGVERGIKVQSFVTFARIYIDILNV